MTTIILTIIGILLAAAAALMVVFYGGDAFQTGSAGASANTLQNNGTNVITASSMFKAETGANPTTVAALVTGNYLSEAPSTTGLATGTSSIAAGYYQVSGVNAAVCAKVNDNLDNTAANGAATGTFPGKMGCNTTDNVFYAKI